jgi:hypothetical protein
MHVVIVYESMYGNTHAVANLAKACSKDVAVWHLGTISPRGRSLLGPVRG